MLLEAIFAVGTIVLTEFVRVAATEIINRWANSRTREDPLNQQNYDSWNTKTAKDVTHELEVIDTEVIELERKREHDGHTSLRDQERKQELELLRANKFKEYQQTKTKEIAEEQVKNPENYETLALENDSVHVLQYHMGQVVLGKRCKELGCGKPMILQSKQRLDGSLYRLDDFFWSCTGFYNKPPCQCRGSQHFQAEDVGFLHKSEIFEFQISNQDLSRIFDEKAVKKATIDRVKSHLKQKDDEILCSIHHVPMILKEKREHQGVALDMFFLGCSHSGCKQLVKLKSPAQLAAYLSRQEGRGIL